MSPRRNIAASVSRLRRMTPGVLLLFLGSWACSDSTGHSPFEFRDPSQVHVIALDSTAPAAESDTAILWAVVGKDRAVDMYLDSSGVRVERLLHFEVRHDALYRKPDGSRFRGGDSILITIRITDPASLQFSFEPSGLVFNSSHPAELTVGYGHALDAVLAALTPGPNGGSGHTESDLAIWLQETPSSPFLRLESKVDTQAKEIEADIPGFSRYAIAY